MLVQQYQPGESRVEYHANRIDLHHLHADESGEEEGDGDIETPWIVGSAEVLAIHQEKGGSSDKTYHGRTKTDEDALHGIGLHILVQHSADHNHQNQGGKNQGKRCHSTAQYRHHTTHAGIMHGSITTIGGGVDADRTRCHLRDGDDIGKLLHRHPMILGYHLSLDE